MGSRGSYPYPSAEGCRGFAGAQNAQEAVAVVRFWAKAASQKGRGRFGVESQRTGHAGMIRTDQLGGKALGGLSLKVLPKRKCGTEQYTQQTE